MVYDQIFGALPCRQARAATIPSPCRLERLNTNVVHQPCDRTACDFKAFPSHLTPDPANAMYARLSLKDTGDHRLSCCIVPSSTIRTARSQTSGEYLFVVFVSMSGKGSCYKNSFGETFFKIIKAQLIWRRSWEAHRQVEMAIFEYSNGFYKPRCRHSALDWPPQAQGLPERSITYLCLAIAVDLRSTTCDLGHQFEKAYVGGAFYE